VTWRHRIALVVLLLTLPVGLAAGAPADPAEDVLGWEAGYWHNESLDVGEDPSRAELRAVTRRAMARLEVLRQREFETDVGVDVVDRSTLRDSGTIGANASNGTELSNGSDWNNQVWEALFIVGEDRDIGELIGSTTEGAIGGFYSHRGGNVSIVTDGERTVDVRTIVHELVHALQDQRYNLSSDRFEPDVQDEQLAVRGLYEGEANYLQQRYLDRCGREWSCLRRGGGGDGGSGDPPENWGVFLLLFQPYSDGPPYVADVVQRRGWDGVDALFEDPPATSETVIHRKARPTAPIAFEDRSSEDWRLFPEQGIEGYDVAGEASIFGTFWYQSHGALGEGLDVIDADAFQRPDAGRYDTYDYTSTPSEGWGNDRIYPYRNGDERGYVWLTAWDTPSDAREFHEAYLSVLEGNGAERVRDGVWRIPEGRFADAFRVTRRGANVTIVNAPTVDQLGAVRRPTTSEHGTGGTETGGDGRSLPAPWLLGTVLALVVVAVSARVRRR
jgi:hypothetical protein